MTERGARSWWIGGAMMAFIVALLLIVSALSEIDSAKSTVGIGVEESSGGILITSVMSGAPAERAGLLPNDVIVAVNDLPVVSLLEYDRALAQSGGPLATFTVERDAEQTVLELEPGIPFPITAFVRTTMVALAYLGLALLAYRRLRQDWRAGLLALLCFCVAVEVALPVSFWGNETLFHLSTVLFFLLTAIQCAAELHLVSSIPRPAPWARPGGHAIPLMYFAVLGLGVLLALGPLGWSIAGSSWLPLDDATAGTLFSVWFGLWALAVFLILAYQVRRQNKMRLRNQALLVMIGVLPWSAYAIYTSAAEFFPLPFPGWMILVEDLILFALPLAMLIAIVRYDLLDMERLVRRGLVYGILTSYLIMGIVLLAFWVVPKFSQDGSDLILWLTAGAALGLGMLASRIRAATERMIERRVFPERHALRQKLIRLAVEVPERGEAATMASHLADRLSQFLQTDWAAVIISGSHTGIPPSQSISSGDIGRARHLASLLRRDGVAARQLEQFRRPLGTRRIARTLPGIGEQLRELGVELLVPLFFRNELIGTVCLSSKSGGELFAAEETELLNLFSHQVAAAFENLKLHQHATYEGLTGLLRREAILETLNRECERAIRGRRPLVVAMADLDRFKLVNDRHGHLFGDHVLQTVSNIIRQRVRTIDAAGRYGGEEFLVVFPDTDTAGARVVAEDLRGAVERHLFQPDNGDKFSVSISIGLAGVDVAVGDPQRLAISLLETADEMLYEAKAGGRNRVLAKG